MQSPNIGFLGTPTLSRLGSSFFSSSLIHRHSPETVPSSSITKPLLPEPEEKQQRQKRRSSHALIRPVSSGASLWKDERQFSRVAHELPISSHCSFGQAVLNGKLHNREAVKLNTEVTKTCLYFSKTDWEKMKISTKNLLVTNIPL